MITLNLRHPSRQKAYEAIARLSWRCGTVKHIAIVPAEGNHYRFACVEMSTHDETLKLLRTFGGEKIVSSVVIELEAEAKLKPPSWAR